MIAVRFLRLCLPAYCLFVMAACAFAQARAEPADYEPRLGQYGKDVMWLPTAQALADKMLNLAKVTAQDYVIDLGSGDGRIVITAAKRGAHALGIEYNPDLVALSQRHAVREGVSDRARFVEGDIFESDFSPATVITLFLLPELNQRLRPILLDLKPGTRIVSNSFDMEEWPPDQSVSVGREEGCQAYCEAFLWIVPGKVEGCWRTDQGGELILEQEFQRISGTLKTGKDRLPIAEGSLSGNQILFSIGDVRYTGEVFGQTMRGTYQSAGRTGPWHANRIKP